MRQELERKLVERWPHWFDVQGDIRKTLMPRGFQCGDGWFDLIQRLCERLEPLVSELTATLPFGKHFEVQQVKQKFGGLRFYVSHRSAAIDAEIAGASLDSQCTCEDCGHPGTLRKKDGWLVTLCDKCLNEGT